MDFRYRRIAFFLTLLATFWVLAQARHDDRLVRVPADSPGVSEMAQAFPIATIGLESAASIDQLPFAALDNTCCYETTDLELSSCTGMVSGEAAVAYRLSFDEEKSLYVTVRPLRSDFDVALGLFQVGERGELICVKGSDAKGEGWVERIRMKLIPVGVYYIVVGGYGSGCGQFELSVESTLLPPVSIREFACEIRDGGALVYWETVSETDLHYFKLYRAGVGGDRGQVVFQPRSRGHFSGGARYEFFDPDGDSGNGYILTGVDMTGREVEIGEQLPELHATVLG
jgi:hypothetical protein